MDNCIGVLIVEKTINETIMFWSKNFYEHIEVLLNSAKPNNAMLYPYFKRELNMLFDAFKKIYKKTQESSINKEVFEEFNKKTDHFITILEELKFEGFNGFPILYEIAYHFLYEAIYVRELLMRLGYERKLDIDSVLIQAKIRDMGFGKDMLNCVYSQIYFWSLIGAEHPSLLMNVTPSEEQMLPNITIEKFTYFINKFNNINFKLTSIYDELNVDNLYDVYTEFKILNMNFLEFLNTFKDDPKYLPESLKKNLPVLFFGVWQHILDEHEYVLKFCRKADMFFSR